MADPAGLFNYLKSCQSLPGGILTGFDFPFGLPRAYAKAAGLTDFLSVLPLLGHDQWRQFYHPARSASEISLFRPFYPEKPGSSLRAHLEDGLGIPFNSLYRLCETGQVNRPPACPLFWTMGGQQVGKAAISGWQDLIFPALLDPLVDINIWPFTGPLAECISPGRFTIVETYPAEYYRHLGLSFTSPVRKSKRRPADRQSFANLLLDWAGSHHLDLDPSLEHAIRMGFTSASNGEDRFDAVVGLYGMINIVLGGRQFQEPILPVIQKVEGWIFGQANMERDTSV